MVQGLLKLQFTALPEQVCRNMCKKNKHIINRIKNQELEINPHVCGQLMWKEGKYIQWVKTTSSINGEQLDANNQTGLLSHITYKNKLKMS